MQNVERDPCAFRRSSPVPAACQKNRSQGKAGPREGLGDLRQREAQQHIPVSRRELHSETTEEAENRTPEYKAVNAVRRKPSAGGKSMAACAGYDSGAQESAAVLRRVAPHSDSRATGT